MIRELDEKDYPALAPLWAQFGGNAAPETVARHYDRMKGDEKYQTFVAEQDGEIVGFVTSLRYFGIGAEGEFMVIVGIAIREDAQNRGIGSELLQHMEDYAREKNVFHIYLNSGFQRTAAHAFYERNGYNKGSFGFGKTVGPMN